MTKAGHLATWLPGDLGRISIRIVATTFDAAAENWRLEAVERVLFVRRLALEPKIACCTPTSNGVGVYFLDFRGTLVTRQVLTVGTSVLS